MKKNSSNAKKPEVSKNRQAFHDYEIIEEIDAGIILTGAEVKSLRASRAYRQP